jgi:GNAT superfamily N-acetyltransferase
MPSPDIAALYSATDATWPSAATTAQNGWLIKDGAGGGKRVCAAIQTDPNADITLAENAMLAINQQRLFQIRTGEQDLDTALNARGYDLIDRVVFLMTPLSAFLKTHRDQNEDVPNTVMKQIWADGGVGPERLNIMARAATPKTYAHIDDRAVAYAAIHNNICMAHAVEVSKKYRRQGLGKSIMHQVAGWAETQGAKYMAVITVMDNIPARTLYQSLGMSEVGHYHYRIKR